MHLDEGRQYQEMEEAKGRKRDEPKKYPYLRIRFEELEKYLDLKEFEMKDVDDDLFKNQEGMLTSRQILWELDTLRQKMAVRHGDLARVSSRYLHFIKTSDSTAYYVPMKEARHREPQGEVNDDIIPSKTNKSDAWKPALPPPRLDRPGKPKPTQPTVPKPPTPRVDPPKLNISLLKGQPEQFPDIMLTSHRKQMYNRATTSARSIMQKANEHQLKNGRQQEKIRRYIHAFHLKFALAAACMIFLFIGAPLGAIIRKGGFGYPVLFGVVLFVVFVALVTVFEKLAVANSLPHAALGAWLPVIIFFIPSFLLTWGAVRDAKAMNLDLMINKIQKMLIGDKATKE
jgi:lipopolysaccharide export system permease protein